MRKITIPAPAAAVLSALERSGYEAYAVGGCCRDALMGRTPNDWDVCTSALPEQVLTLFPDAIPTGLKHGTVTVRSLGEHIEVTTYRVDGGYHDHRRPDQVRFTASLREDLARRDFTMNALAADLRGELTDPFGGEADINRRIIRCVGNAERRFEEDALRMLRAVRFSAQLGFEPDETLVSAARSRSADAAFLAAERIYAETVKALVSPAPEKLSSGFAWGLYDRFLCAPAPALDLTALLALPSEAQLRLAALAAILEKHACVTSAGGFLRDLHAPAAFIHAADAALSPTPMWQDRTLAQTVAAVGRDHARCAGAIMEVWGLTGSFAQMCALLAESRCLSVKELAVTGRELMDLGYSGAALGACQRALLQHVLEHPLDNKKERLLQLAAESAAR